MSDNEEHDAAADDVKVSSSALSAWRKRNTMNMKQITSAANNNMELQLLLLNEIASYNHVTKGGHTTMSAVVKDSAVKKKKEEFAWDTAEEGEFERWQWAFKKWGPALIKRLVMFADPELRKYDDAKCWSNKDFCNQMFEYGFDIRVTGDAVDYVANPSKPETFAGLARGYAKKGHRLRNLVVMITTASFDWPTGGVYGYSFAAKGEGRILVLTNKLLQKSVEIDNETVDPAEFDKISLTKNWSQYDAKLVVPSDELICSTFFPNLKKTLKQQNSDEQNMVGVKRPKYARKFGEKAAIVDAVPAKKPRGAAHPPNVPGAAASSVVPARAGMHLVEAPPAASAGDDLPDL